MTANSRPIYNNKSRVGADLVKLLSDACEALRDMIGDARYAFKRQRIGNHTINLPDRREYFFVGVSALVYGAAQSFLNLVESGLEREAMQFQRHLMEYYFVSQFYAEEPFWAFVEWAKSIHDEEQYLSEVIDQQGSRQRLKMLQNDAIAARKLLQSLPKSQRKRPSMEDLAKRYAILPSDYVMRYRWPSQLTHGSYLGLSYGLMPDGTPRFESATPTANSCAAVTIEYLLSFIDVISPYVAAREVPDSQGLWKRLRRIQRRLKISRPRPRLAPRVKDPNRPKVADDFDDPPAALRRRRTAKSEKRQG